jgi:hypothetical protein
MPSGVAVEKLGLPGKSQKSGDSKCPGDSEKSFIELPDGIQFLQILSERVFQHPQGLSPPISKCDNSGSVANALNYSLLMIVVQTQLRHHIEFIRLCDARVSASTGHFEGTADVSLKLTVSNGFSGGLWIFSVMVALGVIVQFFETFAEWEKLVICTGRTNFPDNPT